MDYIQKGDDIATQIGVKTQELREIHDMVIFIRPTERAGNIYYDWNNTINYLKYAIDYLESAQAALLNHGK